jgi:hypothetical protein
MTNDLPKNSFTEILSDLQARAAQPKELLTTKEAAAFLNVSMAFLERDRCVGPSVGSGSTIPYVRVGSKTVRYRRTDLEAHISKNLIGAPGVSDESNVEQSDD